MTAAPATGAPVELIVHGARGRMGERICALARADARFRLVAELDQGDAPPSLETKARRAIIDFSAPEATAGVADLASRWRAALLVGTTGLGGDAMRRLDELSASVPVLHAPNTSLGVAVLRHLVREAARLLPGWHIDIVETHHARKKDAPSGTALALAEASAAAGVAVPRERIHSLRAGDVIGEHVVQLAGPGETIRLEHSAVSRDLFAQGALAAAAWLAGRPAGRYTIDDALGVERR